MGKIQHSFNHQSESVGVGWLAEKSGGRKQVMEGRYVSGRGQEMARKITMGCTPTPTNSLW